MAILYAMSRWIIYGVLLLIFERFETSYSQTRFYATKTATQCFHGNGPSRLEFSSCEAGHMILVHEAFQGMSQDPSSCGYQRGDCLGQVTPETEAKLYQCIGAQSCTMEMNVSWMSNCRAYSDYNFVIYTCVPREDIMNICDLDTRQTLRTGYIISHGYPANYAQHLNCYCNITTEPNQKMLLTFSDFAIEWSEDCYKDVLHIRDGGSEVSRCGRLLRNHNITSSSNRLDLELSTDGWREHKGFWLQVEALGKIQMECASSASPIHSSTSSDETSTQQPRPKSNMDQSDTSTKNDFFTKEIPLSHDGVYDSYNDLNKMNTINSDEYYLKSNEKEENDLNKDDRDNQKKTKYELTDKPLLHKDISDMGMKFDIFLTHDLFGTSRTDKYEARNDIALSDSEQNVDRTHQLIIFTTEEPSERSEPLFVISPTVGIVIGCCLLLLLAIFLICIAMWCKKHRKKKAITKQKTTKEPRLMRHTFPHINSPRPRMHTPHQRKTTPSSTSSRPHISSPRPTTSHHHHHFLEAYPNHFPESPIASLHSFGSDFSLSSGGRSGVRRGDRVRKERHYNKKGRCSPRLDTSKLPPEEHHNMDSDEQ